MEFDIVPASEELATALASIRVAAMKESLEAVGRFDPTRARERFLSTFDPAQTMCLYRGDSLMGFYVLSATEEHLCLEHLYVHPEHQGLGVGSTVMRILKEVAEFAGLRMRLGALKGSESNHFYTKQGFVLTHCEEWDNYYEFSP